MTVVLALDPSLTACGWAHDADPTPTAGTFTSQPPTSELRLLTLAANIRTLAHTTSANLVALEDLAPHAKGRATLDLAGLHWIIRCTLTGARIPTLVVGQAAIKKYATGKGNAPKDDVYGAAIRRLDYAGSSRDEADALWLHALVKDALGQPVVEVPKQHREAAETLADKLPPRFVHTPAPRPPTDVLAAADTGSPIPPPAEPSRP